MYGYPPPTIPSIFENSNFPNAEERLQSLAAWRQEALAAHEFACQRMAKQIISSHTKFKRGQLVWLEA